MTLDLFGGTHPWVNTEWTASDDRVRGGKSQSYLEAATDNGASASFYGTLDITTLGGAGFASQRTTSTAGGPWDLREYEGIALTVLNGDEKIYTLILKDEILPKMKDGREQSTISFEYSFRIDKAKNQSHGESEEENHSCFIPWKSLRPFYRGKPKNDAESLKLESVERISVMMRSNFGKQDGDFQITLGRIAASTRRQFEEFEEHECDGWEVVEVVDAIGPELTSTETGWKCSIM